jgi:hypothetical protein
VEEGDEEQQQQQREMALDQNEEAAKPAGTIDNVVMKLKFIKRF